MAGNCWRAGTKSENVFFRAPPGTIFPIDKLRIGPPRGGQNRSDLIDFCIHGVSKASFCGDFRCVLQSFCRIVGTRLEALSQYMNGPQSNSKRVISITFWNVLCTAKYRYQWRLLDFLKNKAKTWSQKSDPFSSHLYTGIVFFDFFMRPRKKRDTRDDLWVPAV